MTTAFKATGFEAHEKEPGADERNPDQLGTSPPSSCDMALCFLRLPCLGLVQKQNQRGNHFVLVL